MNGKHSPKILTRQEKAITTTVQCMSTVKINGPRDFTSCY